MSSTFYKVYGDVRTLWQTATCTTNTSGDALWNDSSSLIISGGFGDDIANSCHSWFVVHCICQSVPFGCYPMVESAQRQIVARALGVRRLCAVYRIVWSVVFLIRSFRVYSDTRDERSTVIVKHMLLSLLCEGAFIRVQEYYSTLSLGVPAACIEVTQTYSGNRKGEEVGGACAWRSGQLLLCMAGAVWGVGDGGTEAEAVVQAWWGQVVGGCDVGLVGWLVLVLCGVGGVGREIWWTLAVRSERGEWGVKEGNMWRGGVGEEVHARKKPKSEHVDYAAVAAMTDRMVGAELVNILEVAAIHDA
ncbi:hypothetical protein Tco_1069304 [Tanacetum coccineum]|uniref:Uncharacterized protein n=1 Tax=Tanacetum coccineum TaxID=301880 RepID=A0ABQ5HI36_9ASTR